MNTGFSCLFRFVRVDLWHPSVHQTHLTSGRVRPLISLQHHPLRFGYSSDLRSVTQGEGLHRWPSMLSWLSPAELASPSCFLYTVSILFVPFALFTIHLSNMHHTCTVGLSFCACRTGRILHGVQRVFRNATAKSRGQSDLVAGCFMRKANLGSFK